MGSSIKKNFIYYIFVLVLGLILISFLFVSLTSKKTAPAPPITPSVSAEPLPQVRYNGPVDENKEGREKDLKITQLIKALPYKGENFTLNYQFSKFSFYLQLIKDKEAEGEKEFENYIKSFGVEDKSWLGNLIINVS